MYCLLSLFLSLPIPLSLLSFTACLGHFVVAFAIKLSSNRLTNLFSFSFLSFFRCE